MRSIHGKSLSHSTGAGMSRDPMPRGQFVQFDKVRGAGNSISSNRVENVVGKSHPEDAINLYKSFGTTNSPIAVVGMSFAAAARVPPGAA